MSKIDQVATMRARGYLTAAEVSDKMGNDVATVYRWLDEKKVAGATIGRRRFVHLGSLIRHLGSDVAVIFGLCTKEQAQQVLAAAAKAAAAK